MCLPLDPDARKRTRDFIVSRWEMDHSYAWSKMQAICLGMRFTKQDWFDAIWEWMDEQRRLRKREDY